MGVVYSTHWSSVGF